MLFSIMLRSNRRSSSRLASATISSTSNSKPRYCVGARVVVYWDSNDTWFDGEIIQYQRGGGKALVRYDNSEEKWEPLDELTLV